MRPIDVIPTIIDKLLNTVYSSVKAVAFLRFKVGDSIRMSKFKTIFEKGYTLNWTTEVVQLILKSSKYRKLMTYPMTYLLEDYRGKSIVGGFYEYELHRDANPNVYLVEKVA